MKMTGQGTPLAAECKHGWHDRKRLRCVLCGYDLSADGWFVPNLPEIRFVLLGNRESTPTP